MLERAGVPGAPPLLCQGRGTRWLGSGTVAAVVLGLQGLPSSSPPTEEDFGKGPWLAMKTEMGLDERDPGCFLRTYSVVMVLRKVRGHQDWGLSFPALPLPLVGRGLSWAARTCPTALRGFPGTSV